MCVPGRSAGPCLRSQGTLGQVELSRCRARGIIGSRRSYARSGPVPLRLTYLVGGSAGSVLRSQGTWGEVRLSRCRARGIQGVDVPMLAADQTRFACVVSLGVGPTYDTYAGPTPLLPVASWGF